MRAARRCLPLAAFVLACQPTGAGTDSDDATTMSPSTSFGGSFTTTEATPTTGTETGATTSSSEGSSEAGTESETSGPDTATGEPGLSEDEALLRQAIAGEVDAEEAMRTIAGRGGFPVAAASGGFLFACLCGQGAWTLAGDHDDWAPAPMSQAGSLWWIEADIAAPDGSLYKFHEPDSAQWIADPYGRRHGYDDFGTFSLVRASAAHLERWYAIEDAGLGLAPRELEVLVPQDGAFTHALYVHDGQNLFDPGAFFGGWQLPASAPPNMLVVGITNTPARMDEYTQVPDELDGQPIGGDGAVYAELVDSVIRPRMEAAYGPAVKVGTMGSSLGGLISLVIADLYPDRYDMAISLSGTVGWGSLELHNETILETYEAAGKRGFAIYVDSGGEGTCVDADQDGIEDDAPDSFDNYCENAQLYAILQASGYTPEVDVFYVHAPGAMHNELEWAARVGVPLQIFAGL
ncbi:alpha/beta hydrolase [Nannocystis bainbridge]|uniref:Alpha/beta hydrolase-fold protein n=1 Tax=Nannocystis bainbridge TaxID=2995303 RepID=A0ABT5EDI5_9BACT|nr:alpha/beta hydrolase-fold protein [Nannocystis bainbridge]MDC0722897.1 alpha/beta hydrolase-fold protein [Nannocystis bainbridge]